MPQSPCQFLWQAVTLATISLRCLPPCVCWSPGWALAWKVVLPHLHWEGQVAPRLGTPFFLPPSGCVFESLPGRWAWGSLLAPPEGHASEYPPFAGPAVGDNHACAARVPGW